LRRSSDLGQRLAIELDRDCIERNIELAGDLRFRGIRTEPLLEIVAQRGELSAIGLHVRVVEVDLLSLRRLGLAVRRQGLAIELYQRVVSVDGLATDGRVADGPGGTCRKREPCAECQHRRTCEGKPSAIRLIDAEHRKLLWG
jgi:hypothetical protein